MVVFAEIYNQRIYAGLGVDVEFVQDNHSLSVEVSTVWGLHFQTPPAAQAKLVRCERGADFHVAVDIRKGSPIFGQWTGYMLTAENGVQLFIPAGFAHGFVTLEPDSEIVYKCSDYCAPETDAALRWNGSAIGIDPPPSGDTTLSDKDAAAPMLA